MILKIRNLRFACEDIRWGRCDIKSTSLLANTLMMNNAALKGCNEIIMHKDGIITEAGASNVFFIIDNVICTPSLNNNILPGITRDMSIKIFRKNNINVFEDNFSIEQLSASKSNKFYKGNGRGYGCLFGKS